jgi:hypothetical protein
MSMATARPPPGAGADRNWRSDAVSAMIPAL